LAFYLTSKIEQVNGENLTREKLELALGAQYFFLEDELHRQGASWSKRVPGGVWAYFEKGNLLPTMVKLRQGLLEKDWEGAGNADLRAALHAAPAERILRNAQGPALEHARALLDSAPRGQILLTEEARQELTEPEGFAFQDMGPHLLNDLMEPRRVFVLKPKGRAATDIPALTSLQSFSQNLPAQSMPFLGREEEIESIHRSFKTWEGRANAFSRWWGRGASGKPAFPSRPPPACSPPSPTVFFSWDSPPFPRPVTWWKAWARP
jgi:hypothetical protein